MTARQLEQRFRKIESALPTLSQGVSRAPSRRWYVLSAAQFKDDPVFDEIIRLGREYRRSQRPRKSGGGRAHP